MMPRNSLRVYFRRGRNGAGQPGLGGWNMYRRVNSSRFIVLTTAGIVIVMMVFTWVMYGMAQKVFTLTDVMIEMNGNFAAMTRDIHEMSASVVVMGENVGKMDANMQGMSADMKAITASIHKMNGSISGMETDISTMSAAMPAMTDAVVKMSASMSRMTYDIGRATYAFSQPMSYMWGNMSPF